jgi:uncharacterized phiE125 gp8 family phage protein
MGAVMEAAAAPVGLDEVRAYLRVEHEAEDGLIAGLVRTAAGLCEGFTGQALIAREVIETVPVSCEWRRLSIAPVRSIEAVGELPVEAYAIDIDANGDGWVRVTQPGAQARVSVTYQAGMAADWNGVPEALRQGIIRLVAHLYAHRDRADDEGPPAAVAALWRPWRRMRLR